MDTFDVVVLGGGSGAERVASTLSDAGRTVAVVESNLVGGECPYVACMPSKGLLRAAAEERTWAAAVDFRDRMASHRQDHHHAKDLVEHGVEIVRGSGRIAGPGVVEVALGDGGPRTLGWTDLVVATGADAVIPDIDGLADVDYWTSDRALSSDEQPGQLLVVGGGPIGCELAQAYARLGSEVTLVEIAPRLVAAEPAFVGDALAAALRLDGVEVLVDATWQRVECHRTGSNGPIRLVLDDDDMVDGDRLLIVTGKRPHTTGLGLDTVGITPLDNGALDVDDQMRVSDHVWAVGDVTALAPWTHGANEQGDVAADAILGGARRFDDHAMPRSIYTDPAVMCVGRTDPDDDSLVVARADLDGVPRASIEARKDGTVELYADRTTGVLVGAATVGYNADSWAGEVVLAVHARLEVAVLTRVIHAFPTLGEVFIPAYQDLARQLGI